MSCWPSMIHPKINLVGNLLVERDWLQKCKVTCPNMWVVCRRSLQHLCPIRAPHHPGLSRQTGGLHWASWTGMRGTVSSTLCICHFQCDSFFFLWFDWMIMVRKVPLTMKVHTTAWPVQITFTVSLLQIRLPFLSVMYGEWELPGSTGALESCLPKAEAVHYLGSVCMVWALEMGGRKSRHPTRKVYCHGPGQ